VTFDPQNRRRDPLMGGRSGLIQGVQPPIQPMSDGYYGDEEPLQDWQINGYHMEDAPCDDADAYAVDDSNDSYLDMPDDDLPSVSENLDIDPIGESAPRTGTGRMRSAFWKKPLPSQAVPDQGAPDQRGDQPVSGPQTPVQTRPGPRVLLIVAAVMLVLVLVGYAIGHSLMRIDKVEIIGNDQYSAELIRQKAGVAVGMSRLQLSEDGIRARLETNRYLQVVSVAFGDHSVTITVHERVPVAYTSVRGIFYTLDNRGIVLEEETSAARLTGLVLVDKLEVTSVILGQRIRFRTQTVQDTYVDLMIELRAMDLFGEVASLNLDDPENLSLYTRDGYFVRLGDNTNLHGKLRSMTLVLEQVRLMEDVEKGGTIDVSNRVYPTYNPPGT